MNKQQQQSAQDLAQYVRLLRFGPTRGWPSSRVFLKVRDIARLCKLSQHAVRDLLRIDPFALDDKATKRDKRRSKLSQEHMAYLTSPLTLQKWACKTLMERTVLFHRRFGETKISPSTLRQVYKRAGIKRKALQFSKRMSYRDPQKRHTEIETIRHQVRNAVECGKRIIFTDEAVFTTATLPDRAYAAKGDNITLEEKLTSSPAVAVVAGVSAEMGLEAFFIHARSIDSDSFIQYLLVLLDSSKASEFVIFLDNCRVHHSKKVDQFLKENKLEVIFNVPYGPEYNPIERVWSMLKAEFKKQKMSLILEGKAPNYEKMIREIMRTYPKERICSVCAKTMKSKLLQ